MSLDHHTNHDGSIGHVPGRHRQGKGSQIESNENAVRGSCQTNDNNETGLRWSAIENIWSTHHRGEPCSTHQPIVSTNQFRLINVPHTFVSRNTPLHNLSSHADIDLILQIFVGSRSSGQRPWSLGTFRRNGSKSQNGVCTTSKVRHSSSGPYS